jgi:hypothetical protein
MDGAHIAAWAQRPPVAPQHSQDHSNEGGTREFVAREAHVDEHGPSDQEQRQHCECQLVAVDTAA